MGEEIKSAGFEDQKMRLAIDVEAALGNAFKRGTTSRPCICYRCGEVGQERFMLTYLMNGKRLCVLCAEVEEFRHGQILFFRSGFLNDRN